MNSSNQKVLLEVPLGIDAHRLARQFAAEQDKPQKSKQVYLNTLAVYAAHRYLQWLQIKTDLNQSDSWHPILRSRLDVADLFISEIGEKLECRPVLPGETAVFLPSEVTENRIGYLAVQFSESLDHVQLLGFTDAVDVAVPPRLLLISELQPLEALLNRIEPTSPESAQPVPALPSLLTEYVVNVGRLLRNKIDNWSLSPSWVRLSEPAPELRGYSSTVEEFDAIALQIRKKNQIEIPLEAVAAYRDIRLAQSWTRLYFVTWLLPNTEDGEWTLLLVLMGLRGNDLSQGIKLQVSDQTSVLDEQVLDPNSNKPYQVTQVVGKQGEKFLVTITPLNGEKPTSFLFEFSPEQQP
jgi:hypothetical protein